MYQFKNTEINNKKASEFETKSLLYLIGMRSDSDEIDVITVDCFNDVTGANQGFTKLWDVQSKNHKSLPPSKIGESLVTLYDNFISTIDFTSYILFIPKLKRDYLVNPALNVYGYENINTKQQGGIKKKLIDKINGGKQSGRPPLLTEFLSKVTFIEDNKKISTYVKRITKFRNKRIISDDLYESIFNEVRDVQTALKNSHIENRSISHPIEVLDFKRHITKKEISTLLISRLVGVELFSFSAVPFPFLAEIKELDMESAKDLVQECNENLSRAFFDKNGCRNFWKVSEFIFVHIRSNLKDNLYEVYDALCSSINITTNYLTRDTVLFMISLVMTGLDNEN